MKFQVMVNGERSIVIAVPEELYGPAIREFLRASIGHIFGSPIDQPPQYIGDPANTQGVSYAFRLSFNDRREFLCLPTGEES